MPPTRKGAEMSGFAERLQALDPRPLVGRVVRVIGTTIEAILPDAHIGQLCRLYDPVTRQTVLAEVCGINEDRTLLVPLGDIGGISTRTEVTPSGRGMRLCVGSHLLGRILNGFGAPLDGAPLAAPPDSVEYAVDRGAPAALQRNLVQHPLAVGIRAIDGLLTCGEGQRIGLYGGPGTGKSSLLGQMIQGADANIVVAALVGERGREAREFAEQHMTTGQPKSVMVIATADRPAVERVKAAQVATTIAEYFRDQGQRVVLVIDSITRFARAQREIGLATGEPPTRRGFPPSVFTTLARLLERSGPNDRGSITAFYSVLVEDDGQMDPIAEETRAILDGHVVLSPDLAQADHFPAIDILQSRSRVMRSIVNAAHQSAAAHLRQLLSRHADVELLLRTGEYQPGNDTLTDEAVAKWDALTRFLRQPFGETSSLELTQQKLIELADENR